MPPRKSPRLRLKLNQTVAKKLASPPVNKLSIVESYLLKESKKCSEGISAHHVLPLFLSTFLKLSQLDTDKVVEQSPDILNNFFIITKGLRNQIARCKVFTDNSG